MCQTLDFERIQLVFDCVDKLNEEAVRLPNDEVHQEGKTETKKNKPQVIIEVGHESTSSTANCLQILLKRYLQNQENNRKNSINQEQTTISSISLLEIVKLIVEKGNGGIEVNYVDRDFADTTPTALFLAVKMKDYSLCEYLILKGADCQIQNGSGLLPIDMLSLKRSCYYQEDEDENEKVMAIRRLLQKI